jgi:hypothetical protein
MNNLPITDDAFRPSATMHEALERFLAEHGKIVRDLTAQRDELAACLREVENGFISGRFLCLESTRPEQVANFVAFLTRLHAALADRVAAEQRK